ncbi:MAG: precorrin-8X methylmutase [Cyanobacteriota bacterium]|nr:precorrin-8X methylmutase [Cyanobacteriota bacterium]
MPDASPGFDHPIFRESIRLIRAALADPEAPEPWRLASRRWAAGAERDVLERCIHSSGDLSLAADLVISPDACRRGLEALSTGAPILTDTAMAAAAVQGMAGRTFGNRVACLLEWAPDQAPPRGTRTAAAVEAAWSELASGSGSAPLVLIGSAPTALERLLELALKPSLVIGMPVGFVGVADSKRHLAASGLAQIRLEGSRGGAGLVGAACNALLRRAWIQAATAERAAPAP